jgi:hypothetical protein
MRRSVKMALLILALGFVLRVEFSEASGFSKDADPPIDLDTPPTSITMPADFRQTSHRVRNRFDLSKIGPAHIKEFEKAWNVSNNGTSGKEGLVPRSSRLLTGVTLQGFSARRTR